MQDDQKFTKNLERIHQLINKGDAEQLLNFFIYNEDLSESYKNPTQLINTVFKEKTAIVLAQELQLKAADPRRDLIVETMNIINKFPPIRFPQRKTPLVDLLARAEKLSLTSAENTTFEEPLLFPSMVLRMSELMEQVGLIPKVPEMSVTKEEILSTKAQEEDDKVTKRLMQDAELTIRLLRERLNPTLRGKYK